MSKAALNDINLYYEIEGEGPALMLISGYTTDMSAWASIRHELAKYFRLILVDNRGTGRSDTPNVPYSIEMMAEDIKALMVFLRLPSSYILAHSMGTAIAQSLAINHPNLIKKMVLANPVIHFPPAPSSAFSFFLKMRQQGASLLAMSEGVMPWLFSNEFLKDTAQIEKFLHNVETYAYPQSLIGQKRQLEALMNFNSEDWFKKIDVSTLAIEGEEDLLCPGVARRMHQEMPNASYLSFPGQAHMEHFEKADKFADTVIKYLK